MGAFREAPRKTLPRNIADEKALVRMKVDAIVAAGRYLTYLLRRGMGTL